MIIWKGLGILVPVFAILGSIAGSVAGSLLGHPGLGAGLGLGAAAIGNWFIWKAINAQPGKVLVDPQTGQQVMLKSTHSLFFIPAGFWTWPMLLFAVFLTLGAAGAKKSQERDEKTPGYKEFEAAHALIGSGSKGQIHGNTEAAKSAAREFSSLLKSMASMAFTGGSKKNLMTGGEFLTYCQNGADMIVILCHVPSLRSYKTQEAKDALAELAWAAGTAAAKELDPGHKKTLIVGLRGIASYGSIQKGATTEDAKPAALDASQRSVFYPAFAPAAAAAAPPAPATPETPPAPATAEP